MADEQHTRAGDPGATEPASLPGTTSRAEWDRKHLAYAKLNALHGAALAWGAATLKQQEFLRFQDTILRKHGTWAAALASEDDGQTCAERYAETEAADAALDAHYYYPTVRAAAALVSTPAPDLDAMILKIALIREHDLDTSISMVRDVMDVLHEDADRITVWHAEEVA